MAIFDSSVPAVEVVATEGESAVAQLLAGSAYVVVAEFSVRFDVYHSIDQ